MPAKTLQERIKYLAGLFDNGVSYQQLFNALNNNKDYLPTTTKELQEMLSDMVEAKDIFRRSDGRYFAQDPSEGMVQFG